MREETGEQPAPLRSGLTTGSCATATSLAAARLLLSGVSHDAVHITLPKGKQVQMRLEFCRPCEGGAEAGTIKDAGDDPDVTHGALLYSRVRLLPDAGTTLRAKSSACWQTASPRAMPCAVHIARACWLVLAWRMAACSAGSAPMAAAHSASCGKSMLE